MNRLSCSSHAAGQQVGANVSHGKLINYKLNSALRGPHAG
jgi:hypothetical protein